MNYYNPEHIADRAKELPTRASTAIAKSEEYYAAVIKELRYGFFLATMEQINRKQIPFSVSRVRTALGRYGKGGSGYWWDWLHTNFPLVHIVSKGNSIKGLNSMVTTEIPLDILLAAGDDGRSLVHAIYSQFDPDSDIHTAAINMYSLNNYIMSTQAETKYKHNDTVQQNLKHARMIYMIAQQFDSTLPQVVHQSTFGRTYYRGPNLQNVHKTVRHAALGACYSVDINTSVFNWKYAVVPFNQELTYTRELIQDKARIRRTLAELVFDNAEPHTVNTIKQVLTAISFGARSESKCWYKNSSNTWTQGAISDIIRSKAHRDRLFNDPWMREFMLEQKRINDYLAEELSNSARNGEIPQRYLADLTNDRGNLNKNKLIAWAYQQSEQQVIKEMIKHSRAEVLLQVHDGLYFKTKPDCASMQTVLQDHWPLATVSVEQLDNYNYINTQSITAHKQHIDKEEQLAYAKINDAIYKEYV